MRQDVAAESVDAAHRPTRVVLRMRIAETGIRQFRVAHRLGISDGHLSHILRGTRAADDAFLERIAAAIEDVAGAA